MLTRRIPAPPELSLSDQVVSRLTRRTPAPAIGQRLVSTGSTLLDLAISGGIHPEGGMPPGILVEVFGPSGCGKTVLLCEIAGAVQRQGGDVLFNDPEARLNNQFAALFGFKVENATYGRPDTVPEVFAPIRGWKPRSDGVNAVFADSLAALSTKMEMDGDDRMGMRRAKEFSEECRKTCRVLAQRDILMVCSNQVRQNVDAGPFSEKYSTPGGMAIGYYSSLRLRCHSPVKTSREVEVAGKKHRRVVGVQTVFEVYKSSVWQPHHTASVHIVYDYGVDDIRANLEFVKLVTGSYSVGDWRLPNALERCIAMVEGDGRERDLKLRTIELWNDLEKRFKVERQPKRRG